MSKKNNNSEINCNKWLRVGPFLIGESRTLNANIKGPAGPFYGPDLKIYDTGRRRRGYSICSHWLCLGELKGESAKIRRRECARSCKGEEAIVVSLLRLRNLALSSSHVRASPLHLLYSSYCSWIILALRISTIQNAGYTSSTPRINDETKIMKSLLHC